MGARPSVLRGELVNEKCREEPVCLKYSEGLVTVISGSSPLNADGRAPTNHSDEPFTVLQTDQLMMPFFNRNWARACGGRWAGPRLLAG